MIKNVGRKNWETDKVKSPTFFSPLILKLKDVHMDSFKSLNSNTSNENSVSEVT